MLFGVSILFRFLYCLFCFYYFIVSFSGEVTSVGEERADFFCYRLLIILLFPFRGASSSTAKDRLRYFTLQSQCLPY